MDLLNAIKNTIIPDFYDKCVVCYKKLEYSYDENDRYKPSKRIPRLCHEHMPHVSEMFLEEKKYDDDKIVRAVPKKKGRTKASQIKQYEKEQKSLWKSS